MNTTDLKQEILRRSGVDPRRCMACGKCSAACPSSDAMEFHPHQFVRMVNDGNLLPLLQSDSLYKCLSCMACAERCPRGVEPFRLIEAVRLCAVREQGQNHLTPNDIPALLDPDLPQQAIVSAFRKFTK